MKKIIDEVIKWNKECKPSYETCYGRLQAMKLA